MARSSLSLSPSRVAISLLGREGASDLGTNKGARGEGGDGRVGVRAITGRGIGAARVGSTNHHLGNPQLRLTFELTDTPVSIYHDTRLDDNDSHRLHTHTATRHEGPDSDHVATSRSSEELMTATRWPLIVYAVCFVKELLRSRTTTTVILTVKIFRSSSAAPLHYRQSTRANCLQGLWSGYCVLRPS